MINLAYIGEKRGLVSHDTEHMPKPNSSLNLKLSVRMFQMCICTLWMMPATRFTALGQHKYRPTTNHAGLVTHRDLLVHARSWRNAGTQVVWSCLTFPASSTLPLSQPRLAYPQLHSPVSFPWQSTPRLLCLSSISWTVTISPVHSGSIFLPALHCPPSNPWPISYLFNLLSSFLAGYLDAPHQLFAYWSSVQLSPLARPIPAPVSNINILLP